MTNRRRSVQPQVLHRRTFLRGSLGAASVCVGLPLLEIMAGHPTLARAAGGPPLRFGVFFWGGGVAHSGWVPATTGYDWALPECLSPFANVRDHVTLVTGTQHINSSPGHIPARGISLSSSHDPDTSIEGVGTWRGQNHPEPTVDSIVADAFQGQTPFGSIEIGICRKGPYASNSSWKAGGQTYNRHEPSPQALFDRLFSAGVDDNSDPNVLGASLQLNRSMLDAVMQDANDLTARLGQADKIRMEQHLDGLRAIENRLQDWENACTVPDSPAQADFGDGGSNEQKQAKAEIMSDLLATALACDLTRVFSYEWSATQSESVYWETGSTLEHHSGVTHGDDDGAEHRAIITFVMQNFAYLAEQLAALPEPAGGGTVLDNTLILGTSEHASGGAHDYSDHPFIMLGGAGGRIDAGVHWRDPSPGSNNAPKVLLTAVRAVGVQREYLGQEGGPGGVSDRRVTEDISDLLI
jgi:hypothetical protein